jgi:hypothetical protein
VTGTTVLPSLHILHEQFPGIPRKALEFFGPTNLKRQNGSAQTRTVAEFADHISRPGETPDSRQHPPHHRLNLVLERMADLNFLTAIRRAGFGGMDASYICTLDDEQIRGILTTLDYAVYGFPIIYEELRHSIVPIIHASEDHQQIGSSFLRTHHTLLTAAHCVLNAQSLSIKGISSNSFKNCVVAVHKNDALDLAAIHFPEPVLPDRREIELGRGRVLDEVIVLGYPNVPGFTELLAAERATISAITVTSGSIASSAKEIFAKASLFLITAPSVAGSVVDQ